MVSNIERIFAEIQREANLTKLPHGLRQEHIVDLIMAIVDLEDQHRSKPKHNINKLVEGKIRNAVKSKSTTSENLTGNFDAADS